MDYKKKDEDLNYLNQKPKNKSYKTVIVASIIILVILIYGIINYL